MGRFPGNFQKKLGRDRLSQVLDEGFGDGKGNRCRIGVGSGRVEVVGMLVGCFELEGRCLRGIRGLGNSCCSCSLCFGLGWGYGLGGLRMGSSLWGWGWERFGGSKRVL